MNESRISGTLRRLQREKAFGFIERDDHLADVFLHRSAMRSADWSRLEEGTRVTFTVEDRGRGPRAVNVELS